MKKHVKAKRLISTLLIATTIMPIGLASASVIENGEQMDDIYLETKAEKVFNGGEKESKEKLDCISESLKEEGIELDIEELRIEDLSKSEKEKLEIIISLNDDSKEGVSEFKKSQGITKDDNLSKKEAYALAKLVDKTVKKIEKEAKIDYYDFETEKGNSKKSNLEIKNSKAVKVNDYGLARTFRNNRLTAIGIKEKFNSIMYMPGPTAGMAHGYRNGVFVSLVKTGGAWDLKTGLPYTYLWRYSYKSGEYIGNYHYGYQGKHAGYSDLALYGSAGLYQIVSGTSDWKWFKHYFDDPRDQDAIKKGISEKNIIHY